MFRESALGRCREIILWYSGIFFSQRLLPGVFLMLAAAGSADHGAASLVCPLLMLFWGWLFEIPEWEIKAGGYCLNAVLFGLYLGNTFSSVPFLLLAGFSGSFLLFILTRALNQTLLNRYQVPVCSYPFVLSVFLFTFICQAEEFRFGTLFLRPVSYSGGRIDAFFHNPFALSLSDKVAYEGLGFVFSTGAVFFQKSFLPCLLATIGLVLTSRIMSVMAVLGYAMSRLLMALFPFTCGGYEVLFGFNAVLIGLALGGGFFVPGKKTTALMISAQFIGFFLTLFCISASRVTGGDWTALPFNLVVTGTLLALQGRAPQARPMRPGIAFDTPEEAIAYYRRYDERIFLRSISLPVFGRWKIVQGFDGNETHKEYWRYGVDLAAVDEAGKRFRSAGAAVEDYFAFDAPVLSPVEGVVSAVWADADDNPLGNMDLKAPWGNFVIIYSAGIYIGLYHLKKGSVPVCPGQTVFPGTQIGRVGNSGRSALPHLHLQLQLSPAAGAENIPFLFHDLLVETGAEISFRPFFKPVESLVASPMPPNDAHRRHLFPRNGERWHLEVEERGGKRIASWAFSYTLHGNVVVTSDGGEEIEYHVGSNCVEVTRFSAGGLSPLNLFALSLSDMPFALRHELHWKTVLFGRNAYPFLDLPRRALSWIVGDLFSAMCFKTAVEQAHEAEGCPEAAFSVVSVFSSPSPGHHQDGLRMTFACEGGRFSSLRMESDQTVLLKIRKLASE